MVCRVVCLATEKRPQNIDERFDRTLEPEVAYRSVRVAEQEVTAKRTVGADRFNVCEFWKDVISANRPVRRVGDRNPPTHIRSGWRFGADQHSGIVPNIDSCPYRFKLASESVKDRFTHVVDIEPITQPQQGSDRELQSDCRWWVRYGGAHCVLPFPFSSTHEENWLTFYEDPGCAHIDTLPTFEGD